MVLGSQVQVVLLALAAFPTVVAQSVASLELVLSTGRRVPVAWSSSVPRYGFTVPGEAVAAAIAAVPSPGVTVTLYNPGLRKSEVLQSGRTSSFVGLPTETEWIFIVELRLGGRASNYTISVQRAATEPQFDFPFPDPATDAPPRATLTFLQVYDLFGAPLRPEPAYFQPRTSQYTVRAGSNTTFVRVVASQNDPDGTLAVRADGAPWQALDAGILSDSYAVPEPGWMLLEVQVTSSSLAAAGRDPLVYQVIVTREYPCHPRCLTCYGLGETECVTCRWPFVMFKGLCQDVDCPINGYFDWRSRECLLCHDTCAQCQGPGAASCTFCPDLHFLSPAAFEDLTGPCIMSCPPGAFADPESRRCRRPSAALPQTFYLQFLFRQDYSKFRVDHRLQVSVLNTTAFVLGLALSDVRPFRLEPMGSKPLMTVEVVSPFITRAQAEEVLIDDWFAAFEVPVDEVSAASWDDTHPPPPAVIIDPWLPSWGWGALLSSAMFVAILCPMYCCYFRRLANTRKRYEIHGGVDPSFVDRVVNQSPGWIIKRYIAKENAAPD